KKTLIRQHECQVDHILSNLLVGFALPKSYLHVDERQLTTAMRRARHGKLREEQVDRHQFAVRVLVAVCACGCADVLEPLHVQVIREHHITLAALASIAPVRQNLSSGKVEKPRTVLVEV